MHDDLSATIQKSYNLSKTWAQIPAPERGEVIRIFGMLLRDHKEVLAQTITTSVYKTIRESRGEIQEAIDMCDFAVGLSRQLYGVTMPSERFGHRIQELWQPIGPVVVITAFNFPAAVWAWNFCLAIICGNAVIWKPSEHAKPVADALQQVWEQACTLWGRPYFKDLNMIVHGAPVVAQYLASDKCIALVSATGSTEMGKQLGRIVANRLGRSLLELGGNNATIVSKYADVDLAIKGCVFSAVGTTGQRCTTLRRVFVHRHVYSEFLQGIVKAYATISVGNPMDETVLLGPLINEQAYHKMQKAIEEARQSQMGVVVGGDRILVPGDDRIYVEPCIIVTDKHTPIMCEETFAPILYVMIYDDLETAIDLCNVVDQGLSSSIFTNNINEAEMFLQKSYTGIVNINTSTSGAEIGGAFGGEKDTGGGRESGSDAWKNYMRRVTSTVNYSGELPLAQGIKFG
mgnify:CR=1 FL=1